MTQENLEDELRSIRLNKNQVLEVYNVDNVDELLEANDKNIVVKSGTYRLNNDKINLYGKVIIEPGVNIIGEEDSRINFYGEVKSEGAVFGQIEYSNLIIRLNGKESKSKFFLNRMINCHLIFEETKGEVSGSKIGYYKNGAGIYVSGSDIKILNNDIHFNKEGVVVIDSEYDIRKNRFMRNDVAILLENPSIKEKAKLKMKNNFKKNELNIGEYKE